MPGESELVGLVAYGRYKQAKRLWTQKVWQRNGQKPSQNELDGYVEYWTDDRLEALREEAKSALGAFASDVIAAERPKILKQALKGSFWRAIWPSMAASAFYTLILVALAIIAARAGVDPLGIIQSATN